jgi:thiopeptide-type bacteriocin biosynthesis protein
VADPDRAKRPGSDWLFAKIYGGVATLDRALVEAIAPFLRDVRAKGSVRRWFFLRYADPAWHLRLRLYGDARRLWSDVAPRLFEAIRGVRGIVHRVTIDTYDPEVDRYGGEDALTLAEQVFDADSDAALALVRCSPAHERWRVALLAMDWLLNDFGFSLSDKHAVVAIGRDAQAANLGAGKALLRQLGERFRAERIGLERLVARPREAEPVAAAALERRSRAVAPLTAQLRGLERSGALTVSRKDLAHTFLHMSANRVLRGSPNAQELVLHDLLARLYEGQAARKAAARNADQAANATER